MEACFDSLVEDGRAKEPWWPRKRRYLADFGTHGPEELLVSLADKVYNARAILADYRGVGDDVWAGSRPAGTASFGTTGSSCRSTGRPGCARRSWPSSSELSPSLSSSSRPARKGPRGCKNGAAIEDVLYARDKEDG